MELNELIETISILITFLINALKLNVDENQISLLKSLKLSSSVKISDFQAVQLERENQMQRKRLNN